MMTNHPCPVCYEPLYLILGPDNKRTPSCRKCDPAWDWTPAELRRRQNEDICLVTSALIIVITFLLTYYFKSQ